MTKRVLLTLAMALIAVVGVIICVASLGKERTFKWKTGKLLDRHAR